MPLFGTLKTMALPDLLQWLATARLSGTLQIERNKVSKSILLANGEIVGCSSDDPPERLGQFLLARGKINEEQLRGALETQERVRKHLGMILVGMGALSADELSAHLEAKAEETVYSLFDWQDAVFRFQQGETDEANVFPISLRVEDVLLRGLKRFDEVQRIREVFNDSGIVLRHTAKKPPQEVFRNRMARTLYEAVNGERTVAEILLHAHGSEYSVTKFLFELHRNGYVEIGEVRKVQQAAPAAAAPEPEEKPAAPSDPPTPPATEQAIDLPPRPDTPAQASPAAPLPAEAPVVEARETPPAPAPDPGVVDQPVPAAAPAAASVSPPVQTEAAPPRPAPAVETKEPNEGPGLGPRMEQARRLMSSADYEAALDLLDGIYREHAGDESLRRLIAEAEAAFLEKAYRHYLPPDKVPVIDRPLESLQSGEYSPTEFFLLSRIDGVWDLKSIIQIAPLREVEAIRTLKRLREAGIIALKDPA